MSLFSHDHVMEILANAMDLPADRRGAFLDEACCGDASCRAEVERLLAAEGLPDPLPTINATEMLARTLAAPQHIGRYKIVRELGRGGMGIVYLAEQERPMHRQVAIKLMQFGLTSPETIARFDSERQALAMLSHPNIARVFDGGMTEIGRQYFIMEYVDGVGITEYCDQHQLNTRQRLDLFLQVCDAVHHAHQKGIIHRDIKPSNVLVTLIDNKPVPKVIDFGIAKAVDRPLTERTFFTEHGRLMGTPEYMSPEQASMDAHDVDTRSDVYSLGVLLYELISGVLPFDKQLMKKSAFDELRRLIREVDPPRPSTCVAHAAETAAFEIARTHQADRKSLVRTLRGELDWITMKALEKDRARRYSSVADLAEDVRRYLADQPVLAGPPSTLYRVKKFVRRNRVPVIASILVLLALVAGIIGVAWQAVVARRAEAQARQRFDDVRSIANKLLFDFDDSIMYLPGSVKARRLLVTTALEYLDKLSIGEEDDPELQNELAQAYIGIGKIQFEQSHPNLNDPKGALASYSRAMSIARRIVSRYPDRGGYRITLALALNRYAGVAQTLVSPNEAIAAATEAIALFKPLAAEQPENHMVRADLGASMYALAWAYDFAGQSQAALEQWRQALQYFEQLRTEQPDVEIDRWIASAHIMIGHVLRSLRRFDEAEQEMLAGRAMHAAILDADPNNSFEQRSVATCDAQIAELVAERGDFARAAKLYLGAADAMETMMKADPQNAHARMEFGLNLYRHIQLSAQAGDLEKAVSAMETRFLPIVRKRYPPGHASLVHYLKDYAGLLHQSGRDADATKVEEEIARAPAAAATTTSPFVPAHH